MPTYCNLAAVLKLMTAARSRKLGRIFCGTSRNAEGKRQKKFWFVSHTTKDTKQHPQIGFYDKT